jgi:ferrous iron transport protein B
VGNSNVGKSLLFSLLMRRYVTVSNYPGTTVEVAANLAKSVAVNPAEKDGARRD